MGAFLGSRGPSNGGGRRLMRGWKSMAIHEECGVFGIYDPAGDCARTTYYGLYALQHRGQEACGIAAMNGLEMRCHKDVGLVGDVFSAPVLDELGGTMAVGHVRYSTTGGSKRDAVLRQGHLRGGPQRQSGERG